MVIEKYKNLVLELETRDFEEKINFLKLIMKAEKKEILNKFSKKLKEKLGAKDDRDTQGNINEMIINKVLEELK